MQILFLGAPGAGKGTQSQRLAEALKVPHLSSGDLLREAVRQGTVAGIRAQQYMGSGALVPDDVLIAMFRDKLSAPECAKGFILDGFPRNLAQAESLDQLLAELNKNLTCVIDLAVDHSILTERITGRRSCPNKSCNRSFHVKFAMPKVEGKCDGCGTELTTRSDDTAQLVEARLKTYNEQTAPLIDYYKQRGVLKTVDGNRDAETIFNELKTICNSEVHA
jgi:adenylate kinase